jgi:heptosyltransferase-1
VLDTQGLLKSALIARQAQGRRYGYAAESAREPVAARFYEETFVIPRNAHAVERNRWLAAAAFDYPVDLALDYGISAPPIDDACRSSERLVILLTATSRDDKLWDEANWCVLGRALLERGLTPVLPAGNALERQRAERIAAALPGAIVPPPLSLAQVAALIARARFGGRRRYRPGAPRGCLAGAGDRPLRSDRSRLTGVYGSGFVRNLGRCGAPPSTAEVLAVAEQALR